MRGEAPSVSFVLHTDFHCPVAGIEVHGVDDVDSGGGTELAAGGSAAHTGGVGPSPLVCDLVRLPVDGGYLQLGVVREGDHVVVVDHGAAVLDGDHRLVDGELEDDDQLWFSTTDDEVTVGQTSSGSDLKFYGYSSVDEASKAIEKEYDDFELTSAFG